MRMDDGIVEIERSELVSEAGEMPEYAYRKWWRSYFAEKTVGVQRYYSAKAADDRADMLIQVQRNRNISTALDRAVIDGMYYRITQVQQVADEDGNPVTDVTLERIEGID